MRGFTLIEMIVAIGIFSMVSTLAIGSLLILTSAERHVSSVQINQDNVRFAIEAMSRDIRTGYFYNSCGGVMSLEDGCFKFVNATGIDVQYCRGNESGCSPVGKRLLRVVDGTAYVFTASDIEVEKLIFRLYGHNDTPNRAQPRLTVFLQAIALKGQKNETKMDIQTSVSQLDLDI